MRDPKAKETIEGDPVRQADRNGWQPLRRQESRSRCKQAGQWTALVRWQTTSAQKAPAKRSGWTRKRSSRPNTTSLQGPAVPRQRWGYPCSPLSFWFSITLYISLPLRRASICGHLRFGSVEPDYLRPYGRQGAHPALQCGHENGPAGRLAAAFSGLSDAFFGLAAKGDFGVARMAARPCMGRPCCPNDRQVMDARLARPRRGRRLRRSSALRPSLRLWLRRSLRSWLHRSIWPPGLCCRWSAVCGPGNLPTSLRTLRVETSSRTVAT